MTTLAVTEVVRPILRAARAEVEERVWADRTEIRRQHGVVTFTFDDAPTSALTIGADLVGQLGPSTLYTSLGCCEKANAAGEVPHLTPVDIKAAARAGHQIACHSYRHAHFRELGAAGLAIDAATNATRLEDLIGAEILDFAFPYGEFSLWSKHVLAKRYRSLRGIRHGLNRSNADRRLLRSVSLDQRTFDVAALAELIEQCSRDRAWLIFFTHGVSDDCRWFDVTPAQLRQVVNLVEHAGLSVRTIDQHLSLHS